MKHVILFENFDLEKFMKNPEDYFHDDSKPDIEEGDYITCYRGPGQVLSLGPVFAQIQLFDGAETVVKVPKENLTKITRDQAKELMSRAGDAQKELKIILDQVNNFSDTVETISDEGEEKISGNIESTVQYLEEILLDVLTLAKRDPYTTQYQDYTNLVGLVAKIAHQVLDQTTDPKLQNRVSLLLDKFYEIID